MTGETEHVDKRVMGGTNVVQGTYTYAIRLTILRANQPREICSGSIIEREWILTAAHCCIGVVQQFVIEAGNPNIVVWSIYHSPVY